MTERAVRWALTFSSAQLSAGRHLDDCARERALAGAKLDEYAPIVAAFELEQHRVAGTRGTEELGRHDRAALDADAKMGGDGLQRLIQQHDAGHYRVAGEMAGERGVIRGDVEWEQRRHAVAVGAGAAQRPRASASSTWRGILQWRFA